jgi:hypothetical protein
VTGRGRVAWATVVCLGLASSGALGGGRDHRGQAQALPCSVVNGGMERVTPQKRPASWLFAGRVDASAQAHTGRRGAAFLSGWDDMYQPLAVQLAPGAGADLDFWVYRDRDLGVFSFLASVGGVTLPVTITDTVVASETWTPFHVTVPSRLLGTSPTEVRFHFTRGPAMGQIHLDDVTFDLCGEGLRTATPTDTDEPPATTPPSPTPTLTPAPTRAASDTPTRAPSASATRVPSATPTRTPTPTATRARRGPVYLPMAIRGHSSAAPRPRTWGMQFVLESVDDDFDDQVLLALPRARQAGLGSVRTHLRWSEVEPRNTTPAGFDWRAFDERMGAYAAAGFDALVSVVAYPAWATRYACGYALHPGMEAEWREFVREAARRYGRPPYRVAAWEIGNEVDGESQVRPDDELRPPEWGGGEPTVPHGGCWGARAGAYRAFLQAAYEEIKAVSPKVPVTLGGLANADLSHVDGVGYAMFDMGFLDALLAAGGGPYFDFLSYHWFPDVPGQLSGVEKLRALLATLARHGSPKRAWLTETYRLSYPAEAMGDFRQVRFLTREILPVLAVPELERIYWYGWVDIPARYKSAPQVPDRGLVRADYTVRPALSVLPYVVDYTNGAPADISTGQVTAYRFSWPREADEYVVAAADAGGGPLSLPVHSGTRADATFFPAAMLMSGRCCGSATVAEDHGRIDLFVGDDPLFVAMRLGP